MRFCTCTKWVHLRCSLRSYSRSNALGSLHSWSCPTCFPLASPGGPTPLNNMTSTSGSSSRYTTTLQSGPSGPFRQCSAPNPPSPINILPLFRPLRIFSLCTLPALSCSWLFSYTFCYLFIPLTRSGFFNGMPEVAKPETLNFSTLSRFILWILISRNPTSTHLPLSIFRDTSGPGPGELLGFWGSLVFRHNPIPWKGSGNNNQLYYFYPVKQENASLSPLCILITKYKL